MRFHLGTQEGGRFLYRNRRAGLGSPRHTGIFNADPGSQFTSEAFTGFLKRHGIAISMEDRGAWRGNVVIDSLWKSVQYEEGHLRAGQSLLPKPQPLPKAA